MPRLDYVKDEQLSTEATAFIKHAEEAGSPDPRVLRILFRTKAGEAWYRYWLSLTREGILPADMKELCRVRIAFDHTCGYCSTVRSSAAKKAGLSEEKIQQVWDYENSDMLNTREKLALRMADYLKNNIELADSDAFYADLKANFSDEEIVELGLWCAENVGAGSFVRTLDIITWDQACELNPMTRENARKKASGSSQAEAA